MRSFREFLLEAVMSLSDALKIFKIDEVPSKEELKKLYKKLSMENHPDHGGSTEAMQNVNLAYEVLSKQSPSAKDVQAQKDYEKERVNAFKVLVNIIKSIDTKKYCEYFKNIFQQDFTCNMIKSKLEYDDSGFHGYDNPNATFEFATKDRQIVFQWYVNFDLLKYINQLNKGGLGSKDIIPEYFYISESFVNGKKQVIQKQRYIRNQTADILNEPETIFPQKQLKKISTGEARKDAKLKKRDFESLLRLKYSGDDHGYYVGDISSVKVSEDGEIEYYLGVHRDVVMRTGAYSIYLYTKKKPSDKRAYNGYFLDKEFKEDMKKKLGDSLPYFDETQNSFNFFDNVISELRDKQPKRDGIINIIVKHIKKYNKEEQPQNLYHQWSRGR